MGSLRKPFQGVTNIIRFNWHFYIIALIVLVVVFLVANIVSAPYSSWLNILLILVLLSILVSLLASYFIYDLSDLYTFNWLKKIPGLFNGKIANINAGFDESSEILMAKYPESELIIFDFYDPEKHTEVSIKRARIAYPPNAATIKITTSRFPLPDCSLDNIFLILSAHEIRDEQERINFFKELHRTLKPSGKIIVTEHLRNIPNFIAYNIGFFHFHSYSKWKKTFELSGFEISREFSITVFIRTFILKKYGTAS